jgi:sulfur-carrier protein
VAVLLLFAAAREAAGVNRVEIEETTVEGVLGAARSRFGEHFCHVLDHSRVWLNGEPVDFGDAKTGQTVVSPSVGPRDEVAVLPPVSGGA